MPNYNAQVPPYSIFPGDVALAFNSEAPAAGQASQQFALPSYAGFPENGRTIRWQTIYGTAPSAVSIVLQTAMTDSDAQYATIDTSAATAGEARTVTGVRGNFVRAKVSSHHRRRRHHRPNPRLNSTAAVLQSAAVRTLSSLRLARDRRSRVDPGIAFRGSGPTRRFFPAPGY